MRKISTLLTILFVFAVVGTRADVLNGSFESATTPTAVPAGSFINFVPGGTALIPGWTVVGNPGTEVSVVSGTFTQSFTFDAEDGSYWLDLTGNGTNSASEGVQQTVATTVGDSYTLSFWVGNVYNPGGIFGTTSTVDVSENGTSLSSCTNSSTAGTTMQVWQSCSDTFTATSTSTTLRFLNGDPGGDNDNGLDNISISDSGPATGVGTVPEPSSLALLGAGLLGLAGFARRRIA